jgi:hypothetical protein
MQDESGQQPPAECPEGFDYRQLRAYVRSAEEDGPLPPDVWAHIEQCVVCRPKWNFLQRTDPIVKKQFESRVLAFAEQVTIQEIVFRPELKPTGAPTEWFHQIEHAIGARAGAGATASLFEEPAMNRILDASSPLEPSFVVEIFDQVRSIPDESERLRRGRRVVRQFERRLKERKISQRQIVEVMSKWSSSPQKEVLHDEMTVEVAAIIPETAQPTDPPLLTMVAGKAMFDAPQFQRLRGMAAAAY